ncbi:MAG: TIGR00730 family Rossman fold protein [Rhodospirillaceae bacterium]|nr:TIGR00730 family Rossman fold protein [Rhodospirillaceae bacterium]
MIAPQSVCVYCGSSTGNDPRYREAAASLGRAIAAQGLKLVFGGGGVGLMGVVCDAVLENGGYVIGIIPGFLRAREAHRGGLSELHVVESMHERKQMMFERSDAFVILPGGFGTLDETFEIVTWRQLELHDKPVLLVNVDGYWDPLLAMIERQIEEGFLRPQYRGLLRVVDRAEDVVPALLEAPPAKRPDKPQRI